MTTRRAAGIWTFALGVVVAACVLVFTSDHVENPAATAVLACAAGLAFVTAGLIAWVRRPRNGSGKLMTLIGLTSFFGVLTVANDSTLFTIGFSLGSIVFALFLHFVLAFPSGRLDDATARAAVIGAWTLATLGQLAILLVTPSSDLCDEGVTCPSNRLLVEDSHTAAVIVGSLVQIGAIAVAAMAITILWRRYDRASPALRRTLAPVYLTSTIVILSLLVVFVAEWVSDTLVNALAWVTVVGLLSVPLASLLGLLERKLSRAAVSELVVEIGRDRGPDGIETSLRRVLHDPTLTLARWDEEHGVFVDHDGTPVDASHANGVRQATLVERGGQPIATMIHDPSLLDNRDLLDAVSAAAGMAIENERRFEALARTETRTRALLDAIPDLMFRIARDGTYLDFKAESTRDLYDSEVVGRTVRERLPTEPAERIMRAGERALTTGEVQTIEYELDFGVEVRTYEGRVVAAGDEEFMLIVRDFTQRVRREIALERSESRTRALLDAIPDIMFRIGSDGVYRGYKADDPELLLLPPEEFMGRAVRDVLPVDVAEAIMACGERALEGGTSEPIEYDLELDGQHRFFEGRVARVDEDEFLLIVRDFTSRRRQDDELLALHRQLEERLGRDRARARHDRPRRERRSEHPRPARRGRRHHPREPARRRAARLRRPRRARARAAVLGDLRRARAPGDDPRARSGRCGGTPTPTSARGAGRRPPGRSSRSCGTSRRCPRTRAWAATSSPRRTSRSRRTSARSWPPRAPASSRPPTTRGGGSSGTSTTARSSASSRSRSPCGSRRRR